MKKALICGISGQDGAYLAKLLLEKGYKVYGASRDVQIANFDKLVKFNIKDDISFLSAVLTDFRSVLQAIIKTKPDEIYNLAGQSSVGLSFEQPVETLESIATGTLNLLESIRFIGEPIKLYNAGSSECFGDTGDHPANEETPFRPRSPYAVAKSTAFWEVANYREAYELFACSGILFNHESPLRPSRFVTQKIVSSACRIARGNKEKLYLGNLDISRDWGFAGEYVEAMYRMLQKEKPDDYVIATGEKHSLQEFVSAVFRYLNLNWEDHVEIDESLQRPTDILVSYGEPKKAKIQLNWEAQCKMNDVVKVMIDSIMNS
jgi:GDPmannose 4,6-dehydratase